MQTLRRCLGLLGTVALISLPAPAAAQPVGSEFLINTYTTSNQLGDSVASDASGNFVVVWGSASGDGSSYEVFGQRFDSAGNTLGSEFQLNSYTTSDQRNAKVAADHSGNFVVVWVSDGQDGSVDGVFGQRFDSGGNTLGTEFRVNSYTLGAQDGAAVASDASGNFVVVWESIPGDGNSYAVFGQRYDAAGNTLGNQFQVNSYTTNLQWRPQVASDANGNFVAVWEGSGQGDGSGVFGQRYDSAGGALGTEFRVNSYTSFSQGHPSVSSDASGNLVVVWEGPGQGDPAGIFGQRYDSAGVPQGSEFRVSGSSCAAGNPAQYCQAPSVAFDPSGNFLVVWHNRFERVGDGDVFGQRYDSEGTAQGGEFQINSYTTSSQGSAGVVATGTNDFVVVWNSFDQFVGGSSRWDVFGQRFDFGGGPTIHAGDLDRRAKNVGANWRAQVKTLVHDAGHSPVSGVLVTMNVSNDVGTRTCTTTAGGICEIIVTLSDAVPSLTFRVTNLSKAGVAYDAAENHDPDPDSDGTMIVVNQP